MHTSKSFMLAISVLVLLVTSCGGGKKTATGTASATLSADSAIIQKEKTSWLLSDTVLPQSVDLKQDIGRYTYQELRLLRSYPYAIHGYYFMEADINAFFSNNTKWYTNLIWKLWNDSETDPKKKFYEHYSEVPLTADEQAFVKRVDARMAELRKKQKIERDGFQLNNPDNIVNLFQFVDLDDKMMAKLRRNNFVIARGDNEQLFHIYEENDYLQAPNFITTDLYLQTFHMYFAYVLKSLEQQHFYPVLEKLCVSLHWDAMSHANKAQDPLAKEAAEYAATFYAIPYYLLTGKELSIPEVYKKDYQQEIRNIMGHKDNISEFLSYTEAYFPYSLFKPRGHYNHKKEMQAYFRAMMWLQTASFCREQPAQLRRAVFQAALLMPFKSPYRSVYEPIGFLAGEADNLSLWDILQLLQQDGIHTPEAAIAPSQLKKISNQLMKLAKRKNRIRPKDELTCRDKINFMPQRYMADNEVMEDMVDVTPNSKRAYPKGLDVFAVMGTPAAEHLLTDFYREPTSWNKFSNELQRLKKDFQNEHKLGTTTVYNLWMKSLQSLQYTDKQAPSFMQIPEWGYKNLNTGLASWAELKHDVSLYAEQPMAAECGGAGPPEPIVVGYVEPNLAFWKKLGEVIDSTSIMLERNQCMVGDLRDKTEQLQDYIAFPTKITQKELKGEKLSQVEYSNIERIGSSIEYFTLSIIEPNLYLDEWSKVEGPGKSIAVVADVYTRNVRNCTKNGILYEATGLGNHIYVVVEIEGNLYLTRGATFSYYEFVRPLGDRLTDEQWQQMLKEKKEPPMPSWMEPIFIDNEPRVNDRMFYSSGC